MGQRFETDVAIIGAGPAGLLLAHHLAAAGIDSHVIEAETMEVVCGRIRAGLIEAGSIEVLHGLGLADRLKAEGMPHHGITIQLPDGNRSRLDFDELAGAVPWVYGQTELQKDLLASLPREHVHLVEQVSEVSFADLDSNRPRLRYRHQDEDIQVSAAAIVGCDGSHGPSRAAVLARGARLLEQTLEQSWYGILADAAPTDEELVYARHDRGFALHSLRSPTISRNYLQVPAGTRVEEFSDDRIWSELSRRLDVGDWRVNPGPILDRGVFPMRIQVVEPLQSGRLFLAGDAAHIVPPTGAKGLNLAIRDVAQLAPLLIDLLHSGDDEAVASYSAAALPHIWRRVQFSVWMTRLLHTSDDPVENHLQAAQLEWMVSDSGARAAWAKAYVGTGEVIT